MSAGARERILQALLLVPAVIHLLPLSGVLGAASLTRLYGLDFSSPELELLMRHRAVLFGVIGVLLLAALFKYALRGTALVVGLVSVVSFLGLAWQVGGHGPLIARVVVADWIALACLGAAAALHWTPGSSTSGSGKGPTGSAR